MKKVSTQQILLILIIAGGAAKVYQAHQPKPPDIHEIMSAINQDPNLNVAPPHDESASSLTASSSKPIIRTKQQAIQQIRITQQGMNSKNIALIYWQPIEGDYLIKAIDKQRAERDGSGTVGFYRVTPQGRVTETDSTEKPI